MQHTLEICANSVQSAINAELAGAHRVELCDNLWEGGTTPSAASIMLTRKHININLFVLIRPRGGDFSYSELEFEIIKQDIAQAKKMGADGIVSGVLDAHGNIDIKRTAILVELASPLPFTFHRAFDLAPDPSNAMEQIIDCGAQRILTSGQRNNALDGAGLLSNLNKSFGKQIIIMPGGGISSDNIAQLATTTGCWEFHMSGKSYVPSNFHGNHDVRMNGSKEIPENKIAVSDIDKIKKTIEQLHALE